MTGAAGEPGAVIDPAAAAGVVGTLTARGQTLAAAESLTAGLFCATIAGVPGASAVLRGGLVTYATDLKETLAGVPGALLAANGPVASETARAMAEGARRRCGSDWSVALTGVAGPDPQDGHPVGEVWCAVGRPGDAGVAVERLDLDPAAGRWGIRAGAVSAALDMLAREMTPGAAEAGEARETAEAPE